MKWICYHYECKKLNNIPGVYLLINGDELIYIGRGSDIGSRVTHTVQYMLEAKFSIKYIILKSSNGNRFIEKYIMNYTTEIKW